MSIPTKKKLLNFNEGITGCHLIKELPPNVLERGEIVMMESTLHGYELIGSSLVSQSHRVLVLQSIVVRCYSAFSISGYVV